MSARHIAYTRNIRASGLSIYDAIAVNDPALWIPTPELERLLDAGLRGLTLTGLPLRTRSKVIKQNICKILGYATPKSFRKSQPRFPGQRFDTTCRSQTICKSGMKNSRQTGVMC
jgi:ribosomal protein L33